MSLIIPLTPHTLWVRSAVRNDPRFARDWLRAQRVPVLPKVNGDALRDHIQRLIEGTV